MNWTKQLMLCVWFNVFFSKIEMSFPAVILLDSAFLFPCIQFRQQNHIHNDLVYLGYGDSAVAAQKSDAACTFLGKLFQLFSLLSPVYALKKTSVKGFLFYYTALHLFRTRQSTCLILPKSTIKCPLVCRSPEPFLCSEGLWTVA